MNIDVFYKRRHHFSTNKKWSLNWGRLIYLKRHILVGRFVALIGSLRRSVYLNIDFCYLWLSFECRSASFSSPWADFGVPAGPFRQLLNQFLAPWVAMQAALVWLGSYTRFVRIWTTNSELTALKSMLAHKTCPAGIIPQFPWMPAISSN